MGDICLPIKKEKKEIMTKVILIILLGITLFIIVPILVALYTYGIYPCGKKCDESETQPPIIIDDEDFDF